MCLGVWLGLAGCASTTLRSERRAPDFDSSRIRKVLVVSIASTHEIRSAVEEEFVRQWKDRQVDAVSSAKVFPVDVPLSKADLSVFASAHGFDSVLISRLMSRKDVDKDVEVKTIGEKETPQMAAEENQKMSEYVQSVLVASPEDNINYQVAVLNTALFAVPSEKRLWSGVTQTLLTGDVTKAIRPFVKVILKNLYTNK